MQLKNVIDSPCGIRYMLDQLELQSGFSRRWLLDMPMMKSLEEISSSYDVLQHFITFVNHLDATRLQTILFKLQKLKDIRTTIKNLSKRATLDDIELFEVKHLAILATDIRQLLSQHQMSNVVEISDLEEVISILDPDGLKIATFYVYDAYCERLKDLRNKIRQYPEQEEYLLQATELEESVRKEICKKLYPFVPSILQAQIALAQIDIFLAKALQYEKMGLCLPTLSSDCTSRYDRMFHPQVKDALSGSKRLFQPVDICFGQKPTLITGANMGGKTVVLKTLTLCQYLFQFGFAIPASQASIDIKDEIFFCIGDEQSIEKGLSSFAAEMKNIDAVIKASRENRKLLALIDEPARTTNPSEGTALVSALMKILADRDMSLVMTTHYDIDPDNAHCLRVKGFENGQMNYSLVEVEDGEVPHEALNIAESLDIDKEWIAEARRLLESPNGKSENINRKQLI